MTNAQIDPWGETLIEDYAQVARHFGLEKFDEKMFPNPNRLMRRGIVFAGRDLKRISECIKNNDNRGFAPMTPRVFSAGPSGLAVSFL
jgi:hypothetical protein